MHDENDGPDVSDGYDHEGFIGGCERMRCPGYMKLQQENKRLREALEKIDMHEIQVMYQRCPDCWNESLGCEEKGYCVEFTGKGKTTPVQDIIRQALSKGE